MRNTETSEIRILVYIQTYIQRTPKLSSDDHVCVYCKTGQVSAEIMLEQKAEIRLKLVNTRTRATIQKCQ